MNRELEDYLTSYLTPQRRLLLEQVLSQRIGYAAVILEDIYDPHNANAVIRSAEAMGIQKIFVIENRNRFQLSRGVARGAYKWVTVERYGNNINDNLEQCIRRVKSAGYRVYAATPHERAMSLEDIPLDHPVALMFGSEQKGLSAAALEAADGVFHIPMYGFTESFNISVSAAISLYSLTARIRATIPNWQLPEAERNELRALWVRRSLKRAALYEKEFLARKKS